MRRVLCAAGLAVVVLALASGMALARSFDCGNPANGPCRGTNRPDEIRGTNGSDAIYGRDGVDIIDGDMAATDGANDTIVGGDGADEIYDALLADDTDTIRGGPGNDYIDVHDGPTGADTVDCGPGAKDRVYFDRGVDQIAANCERQFPMP